MYLQHQTTTPKPLKPASQRPWDDVLREVQRAWSEAYQADLPRMPPSPLEPAPVRPQGC